MSATLLDPKEIKMTVLFQERRTDRTLRILKGPIGFIAELRYDDGGRYAKAFYSVEDANKFLDQIG